MTKRDYEVAKKLKKKLSEIVHLIDFRVFGSRARGEADEYSDMDVFLEVDSLDKKLKEEIFETVWGVGFESFMVISPFIFTRDEIENSPLRASPFIRNIVEKSIVV